MEGEDISTEMETGTLLGEIQQWGALQAELSECSVAFSQTFLARHAGWCKRHSDFLLYVKKQAKNQ